VGSSPTPGRAACRALPTRDPCGPGAATRSTDPHPQAGSFRRNAPRHTATARTGRVVLLAHPLAVEDLAPSEGRERCAKDAHEAVIAERLDWARSMSVAMSRRNLPRSREVPGMGWVAFPASGLALASGPIARSKTGEHDPPFRGQCPPETRALPHARGTAQPADRGIIPMPKHSSLRAWTPVTLTSTVLGLRTLTLKVRRVRPSPISTTLTWRLGDASAPSPIVAWNRRALCLSLYTGVAVGSPFLQ
jgi:hypothetical protein